MFNDHGCGYPVLGRINHKFGSMDARQTATRHVLYTAGLTFACIGAALFLIREKPTLGWLAPFAIGSALMLYGFIGMLRSRRARLWQVVRGTVIASDLGEIFVPGETGGYVEYVPSVRTQYSIGAGSYMTDRYSLVPRDFRGDRAKTQDLLSPYPVGALVDVYVNPAAPEQACLRPVPSAKRRSQYLAGIVGGCLLMGIALWVYAQA